MMITREFVDTQLKKKKMSRQVYELIENNDLNRSEWKLYLKNMRVNQLRRSISVDHLPVLRPIFFP